MQQKLLKEYIQIILEQEEVVMADEEDLTFGELKKALIEYSKAKGKKEDIKKINNIGKKTIKLALDFVPFAGAVSSSIELLGSLMTVKDEDRPKGFLGNFDLDDYTSKIIDNKIEGEFLKHILKVIEDKNENDLVKDFDMTTEFNKFLLDKYERKVVGNK
jgi:hypothetical protein